MKSRTKLDRITTSFLLFILVCAFLLDACSRQKAQSSPPPPEVVTMTVKEQPLSLTTELPGRTSAYLVAEVRPQISGIIQKRLFNEGSGVKAGAVLYRIDPAPFQAAYDSAMASLAKAEANLPSIRSRAGRTMIYLPTKPSASRTSTMRTPPSGRLRLILNFGRRRWNPPASTWGIPVSPRPFPAVLVNLM